MSDAFWIAVSLLLLIAVAFFSGSEMGLYSLNRVRLRLRAEQSPAGTAPILLDLTSGRDQTVLSILLLQNLCGYALTVATARTLMHVWHLHPGHVEWYSALILSPTIFVLGDVVPKNWFRQEADRLMYPVARLLQWSVALLQFTGLPALLGWASRTIARLVGRDDKAEWLGGRGEVLGLLREGAAEGVLSQEQTEIVERVLEFSRIRVGAMMIPRRRVITVPIDVDRRTFEHTVRLHPYSRLPVLSRDGRTVTGIVNVAAVLADDAFDLRRHLQEPLVLRAADFAVVALVRLQRSGAAMAIVSEPRQALLGIITLKDVVEEIFGELPAW
jgi:CBS domain containing-hemolysin-like protein